MGRPAGLPRGFVPGIAEEPVDHERAAQVWATIESSNAPPLPHPSEMPGRRKSRLLNTSVDLSQSPAGVAAAGSIQGPSGDSAAADGGGCARCRCCARPKVAWPAETGERVRWVLKRTVPATLLALILWLLSFSGFQHDFLRVSSNDQYKTDIPLSGCAIALACVLLRSPAVVRQLRRRHYSVWSVAERRGVAWLVPLLFVLLVVAGGILNRIRGGMTGPMWGLCHGKHDVKGDDACGGWGDFVGRWGISLASGLLVGVLGGGNALLGGWFAWFMCADTSQSACAASLRSTSLLSIRWSRF